MSGTVYDRLRDQLDRYSRETMMELAQKRGKSLIPLAFTTPA
ncbi:MAG: hypothetical protein ACQEQ7_13750 [Thermodesulfobacteriota bacterium]